MKTIFIAPGYLNHYAPLLRSKFIEQLTSKHRVLVLTFDLDRATAEKFGYYTGENIIYEKLPLNQKRLWILFDVYLRLAFVREHDFSVVNRKWFYKSTHPIEKRILIRLGGLLPYRFLTASKMTALERLFVRPSRRFAELVRQYPPSLMVTSTPGISAYEAEMIHYAKSFKIPTLSIDMNFDHPEGMSKYLRQTDYVGVWNNRMRGQAAKYQHYPLERIGVVGCLRFDNYFNSIKEEKVRSREEFLRAKGLNPNKKTIVYFTSTPISYPPRKEFMEILVGFKRNKLLAGDPNIFVRLHPHDLWAPYEDFKNLPEVHIERAGTLRLTDKQETKGWKVDMTPEDFVNMTETLLYADVFVNFSSTSTAEAAIFGKDTIGIYFPESIANFFNYEQEEHQISIRTGVLKLARSADELKELVNNHLRGEAKGDPERHRRIVETFVQFTDGLSWKRAADFVRRLAEGQKIV